MTRASGYDAHWVCGLGHERRAVVCQRTLSMAGCPECDRLAQPGQARAVAERRGERLEAEADERLDSLRPAT